MRLIIVTSLLQLSLILNYSTSASHSFDTSKTSTFVQPLSGFDLFYIALFAYNGFERQTISNTSITNELIRPSSVTTMDTKNYLECNQKHINLQCLLALITIIAVLFVGCKLCGSVKNWYFVFLAMLFIANRTNAATQYECGTDQWCTDMYPSWNSPTSYQVSFSKDAGGTATNFYILFTVKGMACLDPRITFIYQEIDYDTASEYLEVYDNDNTLLADCGLYVHGCNTFSKCINNQTLSIGRIETNDTYQIRVYQSAGVHSVCNDLSTNAIITIFCAQHTVPPTNAPTTTPTEPTTASTTALTAITLALMLSVSFIAVVVILVSLYKKKTENATNSSVLDLKINKLEMAMKTQPSDKNGEFGLNVQDLSNQIQTEREQFNAENQRKFDLEFERECIGEREEIKYGENDHEVTWKYKQMNRWTNGEILEWIKNMRLGKGSNSKLLAGIKECQCTGKDIQSFKCRQDVGEAFGITQNAVLCELIFTKIKTFTPEIEGNNAFNIHISSHGKVLVLDQRVTQNHTVKYITQIYKEQLAVTTPIEDIHFYYKNQFLAPLDTLREVGIVNDEHLITVQFADGGGDKMTVYV